MLTQLKSQRPLLTTLALVLVGLVWMGHTMKPGTLAGTLLSGLTLGALYFLIASGLTLIFGLMDVLNFAHGTFFMLGAYAAWMWVEQPAELLRWSPFALALMAGIALAVPVRQQLPGPITDVAGGRVWRGGWGVAGVALAALAVWKWALWPWLPRLLLGTVAGVAFALAFGATRTLHRRQRARPLWQGIGLGVLLLVVAVWADRVQVGWANAMLNWDSSLRFAGGLLIGALAGALTGGIMEWGLIRPLYVRPIYQVLLTLGIVYAGTELARTIWGVEVKRMNKPSLFGARCRSPDFLSWLHEHCASLNVWGRAFPSYRLLIIVLGVLVFLGMVVLLRRSRLGMIIRAGVQDREAVEALGINVRRVFTLVFALGTALAAFGGAAASPFIGVYPEMGMEYMLQAFIVVVIGGMGSVSGAALGALLVGLARAFGDYIVLSGIHLPWLEHTVRMSPSIARASTVLIMAIVLMVRPSGLFGHGD
ncbi:MAG: branched-chain amino acid ABC transporter permease [Chloroflexi bacterium]|nr:branched-chain amino acid ABC transporter permease [Chloroflexota bacterium]